MAFSIGSSLVNATGSSLKMPGIPIINSVALTSSNAATLNFTAGSPPGMNYTVTTTSASGGAGTGTGLTSPINVTGLTGNTSYTFTLKAIRGTLSRSATSGSYLTKPDAVTIGAVTSITNSTASVGYTAPIGGATTYTITTDQTGGTGSTTTGTNPIPVTGLIGNKSYSFIITASNATGSSSSTTASTYLTKPDNPAFGTITVTGLTASVGFSAPTNGAASYTVYTNPTTTTVTGTTSPISITTLLGNTSYIFGIYATNDSGSSSNVLSGSSYLTRPDAPTIGTATISYTTASVVFTAPGGLGTITGYTATSNPGGLTGTGASSPISVTGLTAGSSYTFTVTATNAKGISAASSASNSIIASTASIFSNNCSSLTGWSTNGGFAVATIGGQTCLSGPNGGYYINIYSGTTSLKGKTISFNVYLTGGCPNFYFSCDSTGLGQMLRFEQRSSSGSGFTTTSSWTGWTAPSSPYTWTQNTWLAITIPITSAGVATFTVNGVASGITYTIADYGGYIGVQTDGGGGSISVNNIIITQLPPTKVLFAYTGADQTYTIPAGISTMTVQAWGAGGGAQGHGSINAYAGGPGGGGGYASATFTVTSGTVYNIIVGQGGQYGDNAAASLPTYGGGGGESIGGDGHWGTASGGGRSAVQLSISSTYTDIITAGGGGGAGNNTYNDSSTVIGSGGAGGGAGDNINGGNGIGASTEGGKGGTQTAGGTGSFPGSKYTGGGSTTSTWYNAGGGGGWYGGSAGESYGGYYFGGGGGGSSYVDTTYSQSGTSIFLGGSGATVGNGAGLPSAVSGTIGKGATPVRGALTSIAANNTGQNGYIVLLI